MELMDTSLDKFYKFIYEKLQQRIPESILGKITVAVSERIMLSNTSSVLKMMPDDWGSISSRDWDFSPCHCIHSSCGAHPSSFSVGTSGSYPADKMAGT